MTDWEKRVFEYIRKNPGKTEAEIATALRGSDAYQQQVNKVISRLRDLGRVRRENAGGPGHPFTNFVTESQFVRGKLRIAAAAERLEDIQREVGRISMTWAKLHNDIFELFQMTSGLEKKLAAIIFRGYPTDRLQREVAEQVAYEYYGTGTPEAVRVRQIFATMKRLSVDRNAAAHTSYSRQVIINPATLEGTFIIAADEAFHKKTAPPGTVAHFAGIYRELDDVQDQINDLLTPLYAKLLGVDVSEEEGEE